MRKLAALMSASVLAVSCSKEPQVEFVQDSSNDPYFLECAQKSRQLFNNLFVQHIRNNADVLSQVNDPSSASRDLTEYGNEVLARNYMRKFASDLVISDPSNGACEAFDRARIGISNPADIELLQKRAIALLESGEFSVLGDIEIEAPIIEALKFHSFE